MRQIPKTMRQVPVIMTVKEVAASLRCSEATVYRLARCGELPGFRVGGDWRFNFDVINAWTQSRTNAVSPRAARRKPKS